jgi:hypothetical protein
VTFEDPIDQATFDKILQYGHQVTYVGTGEESPPFAYTVGRAMKDRPELLIVGLAQRVAQQLLNDLADRDDAEPLEVGPEGLEIRDLIAGYPAILLPADPVAAEMNLALRFFGSEKVSALQVVWPDREGRFPWAEGYEYDPDVQPTFPR